MEIMNMQDHPRERNALDGLTDVLITATPPTPNGDLHVGHLSGPYLGADIYRRFCELKGKSAAYISGSDDHQSYTDVKAIQVGKKAEVVAEHYADAIVGTLAAARVELDWFGRPRRSTNHLTLTQEMFRCMYHSDQLIAKDAPTLYCENCEKYIFEAYVSGGCPHCGAASGGNACEECGRPNDCVDLIAPMCRLCDRTPVIRTVRRLYFPLSPHEKALKAFHHNVNMSSHLRALCASMTAQGLPDIPVSHPGNWGIPVPIAGYEDQRIYVWFEMAPGYLAAARDLCGESRQSPSVPSWWERNNAEIVQFFGFDNGYFHAILFPAIFHALGAPFRLATTFVMNEFYRLDGQKFSTSRMHAIWGRELLDTVGVDAARFYLAYSGPEREQSNFNLAECRATIQRELVDVWQAWLHDLNAEIVEECASIAPRMGTLNAEQKRFSDYLNKQIPQIGEAYEAATFSPQRVTRLLCELVRVARRFGKSEQHWRGIVGHEETRSTAIALELAAARTLAMVTGPIMPDFGRLLTQRLGHQGRLQWTDTITPLSFSQPIGSLDIDLSSVNATA